jgi:hypothetical protein
MSIEDYQGQTIRVRVNKVHIIAWNAPKGGQRGLRCEGVYHADSGEFLLKYATVQFTREMSAIGVRNGNSLEFDVTVRRNKHFEDRYQLNEPRNVQKL